MELRPGLQTMRFWNYLIHLSQVGRLKKRPSLGKKRGPVLQKNEKKGVPENRQKSFQKTFQSGPQNGTIWGSFRDPFQSN